MRKGAASGAPLPTHHQRREAHCGVRAAALISAHRTAVPDTRPAQDPSAKRTLRPAHGSPPVSAPYKAAEAPQQIMTCAAATATRSSNRLPRQGPRDCTSAAETRDSAPRSNVMTNAAPTGAARNHCM